MGEIWESPAGTNAHQLAGSRLNQTGESALKHGDKPKSAWLDRVIGDHGMEEVGLRCLKSCPADVCSVPGRIDA
jgi:hypothetical protein